jgi:hypothetical protein
MGQTADVVLENLVMAHLRPGERILAAEPIVDTAPKEDEASSRLGYCLTTHRVAGIDAQGDVDDEIAIAEIEDIFEFFDSDPPFVLLGRHGGGTFNIIWINDVAAFAETVRLHLKESPHEQAH